MVKTYAMVVGDEYQAKRLLALAAKNGYDGASRTEAAKIGGVTGIQIVRDWVMKFARRGPEGLIDCKHARTAVAILNGAHRAAAHAAILENGNPGH